MKKFFSLIFVSLFFLDFAFALSILPRTSFLQYKDNDSNVVILQQILNLDPDTQVSATGPGSPGHENWFFGILTENALKRFQQKYSLDVTGKVDYKTRAQLNALVTNTTTPNQNPPTQLQTNPNTNSTPDNSNPNTDNSQNNFLPSTDNPYLSNSPTDTNQNPPPPNSNSDSATTSKATTTSYISNLLSKISSLFGFKSPTANNPTNTASPTAQSTQDIYSNAYSAQTPYCNQQTGICSSNPNYVNQANQQNQNPFLNNGNSALGNNSPFGTGANGGLGANNNNFLSGLTSMLTGNQTRGQQQATQAPSAPATQAELDLLNGPACNPFQSGVDTALVGGNEGVVCGKGSNFGNNPNGTNDSEDNGAGCFKPGGGRYDTRKGRDGQEGIALPPNIQIAMFGSLRAACGGWVQVTLQRTGKCKTFRIVDTGPNPNTGRIIDLTGVAENVLGGQTDDRYCFKKAPNQNPQTPTN